jgi:hypothetical protein
MMAPRLSVQLAVAVLSVACRDTRVAPQRVAPLQEETPAPRSAPSQPEPAIDLRGVAEILSADLKAFGKRAEVRLRRDALGINDLVAFPCENVRMTLLKLRFA